MSHNSFKLHLHIGMKVFSTKTYKNEKENAIDVVYAFILIAEVHGHMN